MIVASFFFKTFDESNQIIQVNVNRGPERNESLVFHFYTDINSKFPKALFSFKIYANDASIDQMRIEKDISIQHQFSVFYSFFAIKEILEFIRDFTKVDTLQFPKLSKIHQQNAVLFYRVISNPNFRISEYKSWCKISGTIPAGSNKEDCYHRANLFQFTNSLGFSLDISKIRINNRSSVKLAIANPKTDGGRKPVRKVTADEDEMLQYDDRLDNKKGEVHFYY
jgi:hypothetical protein